MELYEQHKKTHVTQKRKTKTQTYGKSMGYIHAERGIHACYQRWCTYNRYVLY